jgi:hypothetical protein
MEQIYFSKKHGLDLNEALDTYNKTKNTTKAAQILGVTFGQLQYFFERNNVPTELYKPRQYNIPEIIEVYKKEKDFKRTGKVFNLSGSVVKQVLLKSNVQVHKQNKVSELNIPEVIETYFKLKSAKLTAPLFGITQPTLCKILHNNGIPTYKKGLYTDEEIIKAFKHYGTVDKTRTELKIGFERMCKLLRKYKIPVTKWDDKTHKIPSKVKLKKLSYL